MNISQKKKRWQRGWIQVDLMIAISLISLMLIPMSMTVHIERVYLKQLQERAVIGQVLDGELEFLLAGGLKPFGVGEHSLPDLQSPIGKGSFSLVVTEKELKVEWRRKAGDPDATWRRVAERRGQ